MGVVAERSFVVGAAGVRVAVVNDRVDGGKHKDLN